MTQIIKTIPQLGIHQWRLKGVSLFIRFKFLIYLFAKEKERELGGRWKREKEKEQKGSIPLIQLSIVH